MIKNRRPILIAALLLLSIGNYNRIIGNESIRAIQFLSIFTIGLLSGILIFSLIEKFKKP